MRRTDFSYDLPEELIAQAPLTERSASRLLTLDGVTGEVGDRAFQELPWLLEPGDLLVLNDTRVIPARLLGRKASGGAAEVLVERVIGERRLLAHVRASKPPRPGGRLLMEDALALTVCGREGELYELELEGSGSLSDALETYGRTPLPPYIRRSAGAEDVARYQTVYGRRPGAVAAPTAGLHFDPASFEALERGGVGVTFVTLHVGSGTFLPVRAERVEEHRMHAERVEVSEVTAERVRETRDRGKRVVAVGTTVVRALETATGPDGIAPFAGETCLFVYPGYRFRSVDALLTNFHLPESTLLMLVCAFAGTEHVLRAYRHAVAQRYRFFSYGDAMLVSRPCPAARTA